MAPVTRAGLFFFFNDTATTEIYTLSLHDALPISGRCRAGRLRLLRSVWKETPPVGGGQLVRLSSRAPGGRRGRHNQQRQASPLRRPSDRGLERRRIALSVTRDRDPSDYQADDDRAETRVRAEGRHGGR